jgi:hypothetical protein
MQDITQGQTSVSSRFLRLPPQPLRQPFIKRARRMQPARTRRLHGAAHLNHIPFLELETLALLSGQVEHSGDGDDIRPDHTLLLAISLHGKTEMSIAKCRDFYNQKVLCSKLDLAKDLVYTALAARAYSTGAIRDADQSKHSRSENPSFKTC